MKNIFTLVLTLFSLALAAQNFTFTNYTEAEGLISNTVNCVTVDAADNIWFGTQNGISKFDGTTWTSMDQSTHPGLVDNSITAIFVDKDDVLWVGTDFGVSRLDGADFSTFTVDDGLADNRVTHITQGTEGIVWIANKDGVTLAEEGAGWSSLVMADGIPFGGVTHTNFGSFGRKYFSTPLSGLLMYDGVFLTAITENDGLVSEKIRSSAIGLDGKNWIATSSGIAVLDDLDKHLVNYTRIFELPAPDTLNPVEDVKIDSKGRIWAGVYIDYLVTEGGVSMFNGSEWQDYDVSDGMIGPVVRQLAIDSEDNVWVATSTGVTKISEPTTSVSEIAETGFEVFPNPVSDILTIKIDEELDFQTTDLRMYNPLGQLVKSLPIAKYADQIEVSVSGLSKGFYFVSIGGRSLKVLVE